MSERRNVVVEFIEVRKSFGTKVVLDGLSFVVRRGETVVVLGGSGSGKSVMLKHINGLMRPDAGGVLALGCGVSHLDEGQLIELRRKISYIFQQSALFDSLSVGENIAYPLRLHTSLGEAAIADKVKQLLARVGLAGTERLQPAELSGGMRKRVALARGLALEPELILYDEPTAGLDPMTALTIVELIREVASTTGATSLIVTHDLIAARHLADRVAFLEGGKFTFEGTLAEAQRAAGTVGGFVRAGGFDA